MYGKPYVQGRHVDGTAGGQHRASELSLARKRKPQQDLFQMLHGPEYFSFSVCSLECSPFNILAGDLTIRLSKVLSEPCNTQPSKAGINLDPKVKSRKLYICSSNCSLAARSCCEHKHLVALRLKQEPTIGKVE